MTTPAIVYAPRRTKPPKPPKPPKFERPEWSEAFGLIDGCARAFVGNIPRKDDDPWDRRIKESLRHPTVCALRWLWRHSDGQQRATIATRLAVWADKGTERVSQTQTRILFREKAREEGRQL